MNSYVKASAKKLWDSVIATDHESRKVEKYSVETFYGSTKLQKRIVEPLLFHTPQFSRFYEAKCFSVVKSILEENKQGEILPTLEASKLGGCGGAHFPVAIKWKAALQNPGPRYLVVNGQEGEESTFKDYMIMKFFPELVVEGAMLAALALGVSEVLFVINSSYDECQERISQVLKGIQGKLPGLNDIVFRVVVGPKPDLYICGEETALIEYLEGRRGEAQLKPPFPFQAGYRGRPTVIQNIETLAWIPLLMRNPLLFQEQGVLKLVHIYGAVERPGIYEVKVGSTLQDLLLLVGGVKSGAKLQAIEVGGVAGGLLPPKFLSLAMTPRSLSENGAMLGTGSVNFLSFESNLIDVVLHAMEFFRSESCGRCMPCRVGTYELQRMASLMTEKSLTEDEEQWFSDVIHTMVNGSICGLGKGAPSLLLSLVKHWDVKNGQASLKDELLSEQKGLVLDYD